MTSATDHEPRTAIAVGGVVEWHHGSPQVVVQAGRCPRRLPADRDHLLWWRGFSTGRGSRGAAEWQAAYLERGPAAAAELTGPFAAALWDRTERCLVLLRDRAGTYGLHHATVAGSTFFSPSLDALLEALGRALVLDQAAVARHLHGVAPAPGSTFVAGIASVPPATVEVVSERGTSRHRYWSLRPGAALRLPGDDDYADALASLLDEVVPTYAAPGRAGVTLSGGLDSTTVAAVLGRRAPETDLEALAWRSPTIPEGDESERSALVAGHLGIPLRFVRADHSLPWTSLVGSSAKDPAAWRPYGLYAELLDATFATFARAGVDVVFTGVPGDPLFGNAINPLPDLLLRGRWRALLAEVGRQASLLHLDRREVVRRRVLGPVAHTYLRQWGRRNGAVPAPVPWLAPELRRSWPDICRQPPEAPARLLLPGRRDRFRDLVHPFQTHTLENLTRHAAAHGIELRHPLSDHRLVEFAARVPTEQASRGAVDKQVVRRAMRGRLPAPIVDRPGKTVQIAWLRRALRCDARAAVEDLSSDMALAAAGVVDEERFREACTDYLAGRSDDPSLCHTLAIEEWVRERS